MGSWQPFFLQVCCEKVVSWLLMALGSEPLAFSLNFHSGNKTARCSIFSFFSLFESICLKSKNSFTNCDCAATKGSSFLLATFRRYDLIVRYDSTPQQLFFVLALHTRSFSFDDQKKINMATPAGIAHTDGAKLSVFRGYDTSHLVVDETWGKQKSGDVQFPKSKAVAAQDAIPEGGRTYHGYNAGSYYLPNDPEEHERLDHQHRMVRLIQQGKLGLAPVRNPKDVIDVCTGTGIWATEYAAEHPDCAVLGSDLSAIQPREGVPNCTFIQHDVEKQDWDYGGRQFDYAYFRYMVTCFDDMPAVLRKARDSLREGGYIEIFDTPIQALSLDGTIDGTALEEWGDVGRAAGLKLGRDMAKPRQYKRWLEEAGFVDVVETIIAAPVNEWCQDEHQKEVGRFMFHDFYALLGGLKKLVLAAGYTSDDADDFLRRARATIEDPHVHAYYEKYIVYGRKPRAGEVPVKLPTVDGEKESTETADVEKPTGLSGMIISSLVMCRDSLRSILRNRLGLDV